VIFDAGYDLTRLAWLLADLPVEVLGRLHQRLTSRTGWEDHDGKLPVIEGTLIRLHVSRLPGNRSPERFGYGPPPPGWTTRR
jgi:hypothetical protein